MTIEIIALSLSGISVAFAIFFGLANKKRAESHDATSHTQEAKISAAEMEALKVNMGNILNGLAELKKDFKDDSKATNERIIAIGKEAALAREIGESARRRIDDHILKGVRND